MSPLILCMALVPVVHPKLRSGRGSCVVQVRMATADDLHSEASPVSCAPMNVPERESSYASLGLVSVIAASLGNDMSVIMMVATSCH